MANKVNARRRAHTGEGADSQKRITWAIYKAPTASQPQKQSFFSASTMHLICAALQSQKAVSAYLLK